MVWSRVFVEGGKLRMDLGRGQAIATVYNAIHAGNPDPELLAILQLDTLSKFANSPNSKRRRAR